MGRATIRAPPRAWARAIERPTIRHIAVEARLRCEATGDRRFSQVFTQLRSELDRVLWVELGAPPKATADPLDPFRLFGGERR